MARTASPKSAASTEKKPAKAEAAAPTLESINAQLDTLKRQANTLLGFRHKLTHKPVDKEKLAADRKAARKERYKTNNDLTIEKLRKAGHTVSVTHLRYVSKTTAQGTEILVPVPCSLRSMVRNKLHPQGGQTWIAIKTIDDKNVLVESTCHMDDHYEYKMGVKLALDSVPANVAEELLAPLEVLEAAQA